MDMGFFSPLQYLLIQDACAILSLFKQATVMVRYDEVGISYMIPLLFLL